MMYSFIFVVAWNNNFLATYIWIPNYYLLHFLDKILDLEDKILIDFIIFFDSEYNIIFVMYNTKGNN